jgi:2-polyprenyl-6-methoxyphenol hydroxylase-like FAD-dependent oxidoreductase
MASSPLRIAIVGGGPAGLTLGALLHKRGISFTIFELRHKPTDEELTRPSGSLDLHEGTGLAALKEAGLLDEFTSLTGDCSEADVIAHKNGQILYKDEGENSNRPEISRHKLNHLLQSHVPASAIKWEHKLISAERSTSTSGLPEVQLDFGENGKHTFDLVIGADGAWSRVRNILTDQKPEYAEVQCITLNITQLTSKYPKLSEYVGSGTFAALGGRHGVMSQRSGDDSTRIYLILSADDEDFATTSGLGSKTPAQARDQLLGNNALLGEWGTPFPELVTAAFDNESAAGVTKLDIKPLYRLPVGHSWEHKSGVTLIGDSAHLMCPWAGEGVNLAMRDSLELSRAIVKARETAETGSDTIPRALDPLVQEFETDMVARSKDTAQETLNNGKMMFGGDDGSTAMVNWFKSFMPPAA